MDNKFKDNEIIKALECLFGYVDCRECPYSPRYEFPLCQRQVAKDTLDLITRQKTENENLKVKNQSLRTAANSLKMHYEEAQAEIERLKRELDLVIENSISERYPHCVLCGNGAILTKSLEEYDELIADISAEAYKEFAMKLKCGVPQETGVIRCSDIDNLLKEMVGEDNA